MVLKLIRALLGAPGLLAAVACVTRERRRKLDPSVGGSGPHDFAVRTGAARLAARARPSHPTPRFVTTRNAPQAGTGRCG